MQSMKSPSRRLSQYHFCVRVTPKVLSKFIFENRGIESLYKLQINKTDKRETYNVMKRNIHQEALQGYYQSQNCYFSLNNYSNFKPYEMQVIFSEINQNKAEEKTIFVYKFSTYSMVKNFNENGVRRTSHIVAKDFQTEFFIDFYIQDNKMRLEDKVRSDSNKQNLKKKHFKDFNNMQKDSKKHSQSGNSPSKSSFRTDSKNYQSVNMSFLGFNSRSSSPLVHDKYGGRRRFLQENLDNARSQRVSSSRNKKRFSQNVHESKMFLKKQPGSKLFYRDYMNATDRVMTTDKQQSVRKYSYPNKMASGQKEPQIKKNLPKKAQIQTEQQDSKNFTFFINMFLSIKNLSFSDILNKMKQNLSTVVLVCIIIVITILKPLNSSVNQDQNTKMSHQNHKDNRKQQKSTDDYEQDLKQQQQKINRSSKRDKNKQKQSKPTGRKLKFKGIKQI